MHDYIVPRFLEDSLTGYKGSINPRLLFYRFLNGESDQRSRRLAIFKDRADLSLLDACRERERAAREFWRKRHGAGTVAEMKLSLIDRMMVGMGIESDFENGLLLHWIHGFPYINGEALKGAAKAWAFETGEQEKRQDQFLRIFGSLSKQEKNHDALSRGEVIFFDAIPESARACFDIDILTPHYAGYYTDDPPKRPGGWEQPTPVAFLAVSADTAFVFSMAGFDAELVRVAAEWLKSALIKRGIGAKRRAGYGHFAEETNVGTAQEPVRATSPLDAFLHVLEITTPDKLIGQAEEFVNKIKKLPDEDRKAAAIKLTERITPKTLRKKAEKKWAVTLRSFKGED